MTVTNFKWWWFATATLLLNALLIVYSIATNSELIIEYTLLIEFAGGLLISVINLLASQKLIVYRASLGAAAGSAATVLTFLIYLMFFGHTVC